VNGIPAWVAGIERGPMVVYHGRSYRTWMVSGYRVAVRVPDGEDLSDFDASDITGRLTRSQPRWVMLRPESVDASFVSRTTATWHGWHVWLAGTPNLLAGTVPVGSRDPFDDTLLRGRKMRGAETQGWFAVAPLGELDNVNVERIPRPLRM
jgi:hypothetical protein